MTATIREGIDFSTFQAEPGEIGRASCRERV